MNLIIQFGPKFTQAQMEEMLAIQEKLGGMSWWDHSFREKEMLFDFAITEWIATEQIAFLFAWIRNLKGVGRNIRVRLPFTGPLPDSGYYTPAQIQAIGQRYKNSSGEYRDSEDRRQRRERCTIFLLVIWGMLEETGLKQELGDFIGMPDDVGQFNRRARRLLENNHQIIPFSSFDLSVERHQIKYDFHFQEMINNNLDATLRTRPIFNLQRNIQTLLKQYACYSPFESKILSNVITQELFINSLQHADYDQARVKLLAECYMTTALANSWQNPNSRNFIPSFTEEKYTETLDFYKDKELIRQQIDATLKKNGTSTVKSSREANLVEYDKHFLNRSYLEFSFLDFGIGIPASLRERFRGDMGKNPRKEQLSPGFALANEDARILEYAFLMDTSRNPLDTSISHYELVPRGLYFLIDMIRRYKGMLIVRSGQGKIIYDFSNRIYLERTGNNVRTTLQSVYKLSEAIRHISTPIAHFPGTLVTIVLPENTEVTAQTHRQVLPPVRTEQSILSNYVYNLSARDFTPEVFPKNLLKPASYEYIGILFLYNSVIERLRKQRTDIEVINIYTTLFLELDKAIDGHQGKSCVIFFDFAGSRKGNPFWIKVLYFLLNSPKINELTKAVIVNLPSDEQEMIKSLKENLTGGDRQGYQGKQSMYEPLLYRPIPCVRFSITATSQKQLVRWIGLKDSSDEDTLTDLLLGKDSYSLDTLNIPINTQGNMFIQYDGRLYSTVSGFDHIKEQFFDVQRAAIARFLGDHVEVGVDLVTGAVKHVYLASNGGYQFSYLTLYELLHDKYISFYFAKCLLDKYCSKIEIALREAQIAHPAGSDWPQAKNAILSAYRFTKIIAVTVSSQLIGIAIRDLIENDDNYEFLRVAHEKGLDKAPELIMLSSYYSFATEKPFERIGAEDKVLIVNDVISTGRLVKEILNQIDKIKQIVFTGVFSILDSRIHHIDKELADEMDCEFFLDNEKLFFTLCNFDDRIHDPRIVLRKFKAPYKGDAFRKRINPLLNTVVELKSAHSEQQKILIPDLRQIVDDKAIHDGYFMVGHFQQNLSHNAYITNMRSLFGGQDGVLLVKQMKGAIEKVRLSTGPRNDEAVVQITDVMERLEVIERGWWLSQEKADMKVILQALGRVKGQMQDRGHSGQDGYTFQPDFIFYPHFSGIEKINHITLSDIFGTHPDHIIGLQRFDTPKGWRFPFPARRYNELTRNKDVLILDSGLLTGESMIQLIDNIAFLDVRSITVLAIITRVDDFHREFYSRLRSIKVKRLKGRQTDNSNLEPGITEPDHIVPLELVFGICLNIPVFTSAVSCPFCEELQQYTTMIEASYPRPTIDVEAYVEMRRKELRCMHSSREVLDNISYIPRRRNDQQVDSKRIFYARDLLGKIDSYRFFPEYFEWAESLEKDIRDNSSWMADAILKRDVECVLICILHEPNLHHVVNNLVHGLLVHLNTYVYHVLFESQHFDDVTYYKWQLYPLVRLALTLLPESIYSVTNFEHILRYNDTDTRKYLHYYCWNILYHPQQYEKISGRIDDMLREFGTRMRKKGSSDDPVYLPPHDEFYQLAASRYELASLQNYKFLDRPFNNLSLYVHRGLSKGRHLRLKMLVNNVYDAVNSTAPSLTKISDCLHLLNDEFSYYLRPSIEKIAADPNLHGYVEIIYRYLIGGSTSILYYIERIESLYAEIKRYSPSDLPELTSQLREIKTVCNFMINHILSLDDDQNQFFHICEQYPCDLKKVLDEIELRCAALNIRHTILQEEQADKVLIAHHPAIFREMLLQLVDNAARVHAETLYIRKESLELRFRYETGAEEPDTVKIFYSQNFPFRPTVKNGGLEKLVRHYTLAFAGEFTDNRSIAHDEYEIQLKFKLYKYDDNLSKEKPDHPGEDVRTD